MTPAAASGRKNRLAHETSPYLLQHRHNPVDWWPWNPEALQEARRTGKPILLSVGYAACHWCHVMAHESFEDEATAAVMNELFVNIKVDREERPDIDQIYMSALHHLGEQGGWPLTMFLTPAAEPVWGGTYFPKEARYGRPAFVDVMREVSRLFSEEPEKIEQNRNALMGRLKARAAEARKVSVGWNELDNFAMQIARLIDTTLGGVRGAPKFPQTTILEFLWRAGIRGGDERFFTLVEHTLERMCEGGIYDHLGGGFSRYSVDERWLVPHFEKMLYDNALLLELLALAHLRSGNPLFRVRATETVEWLKREMTTTQGAFCASIDADSEGEEGKYYVWSRAEIERLLGPEDANFFSRHYDVTPGGNFEGHNILNRLANEPRTQADEERLRGLRKRLLEAREMRVRPGLDDKVLADWNGLMIAALTQAGLALGEPGWIALARRAFTFVKTNMIRAGRLGHSWREDRLLYPGLASDFAAMIRAALTLHEATGEQSYLDDALSWQDALDRHYGNEANGGYFLTADDAEGLVIRPSATVDDATPNPNAVAAQNLIRIAAFTGEDKWRERADDLIDGILSVNAENLFGHLALFNAVDLRVAGAEILVTGNDEALVDGALRLPFFSRTLVRATSLQQLGASHPAREKLNLATGPAAFVCVGQTCSLPATSGDMLAETFWSSRKNRSD